MALVDDIKRKIRIKHIQFDGDIGDLIAEAKLKLKLDGIEEMVITETDPLIKRAIIMYSEISFETDVAKAKRLQDALDALIIHLCLCAEYRTVI